MDWYAQTKLGLTRTLSEENVYEDILGKRPHSVWRAVSETDRVGTEFLLQTHVHALEDRRAVNVLESSR